MNGQTVKDFVMTMPDVCDLLQRSRIAVYGVMKRFPDFPKPENSGRGKMLIWMKADVMAWFEQHKDEVMEDLKYAPKGK
ncbi:helix-turn-helix transcriptional regulator [Escherichia coli]|uniref:helix-turn-helix transcriptional regulator n=1 Tax=Escherichia coli TaxID=562 RepID=UPI000BE51DCA|nr:hypothetical protein [Escherichia coli]